MSGEFSGQRFEFIGQQIVNNANSSAGAQLPVGHKPDWNLRFEGFRQYADQVIEKFTSIHGQETKAKAFADELQHTVAAGGADAELFDIQFQALLYKASD